MCAHRIWGASYFKHFTFRSWYCKREPWGVCMCIRFVSVLFVFVKIHDSSFVFGFLIAVAPKQCLRVHTQHTHYFLFSCHSPLASHFRSFSLRLSVVARRWVRACILCVCYSCVYMCLNFATHRISPSKQRIFKTTRHAQNTTSNMRRQKKANCTDSKRYGETIGLRIIIVYCVDCRVRAILFCIYYIPHTRPIPHRSPAEWNAKCYW